MFFTKLSIEAWNKKSDKVKDIFESTHEVTGSEVWKLGKGKNVVGLLTHLLCFSACCSLTMFKFLRPLK